MKRLDQKIAVVTGGNSGIGKGIVKQFHAEGAHVVAFGRNQNTLDELKNELPEILTIQGDVTSQKDLKNLYQQTIDRLGKIDVLVVNSGVGERSHVEKVTEDSFDTVVNTNYRGAYFTVKYALEHLNEQASIIMIGSIAGHTALKNHTVYASTKAAVIKLAKNLAYDLSPRLIRVNSISPGYIDTPIFAKRLKDDPNYLEKRAPRIPLKRIGKPSDIAHAAVFLASDESTYITGTDLIIDGGYSTVLREDE